MRKRTYLWFTLAASIIKKGVGTAEKGEPYEARFLDKCGNSVWGMWLDLTLFSILECCWYSQSIKTGKLIIREEMGNRGLLIENLHYNIRYDTYRHIETI